jgi:hypothetical protein
MGSKPTQFLRWFTADDVFTTETTAKKGHVAASIALMHTEDDTKLIISGDPASMRRHAQELRTFIENLDAAIAFAEQK